MTGQLPERLSHDEAHGFFPALVDDELRPEEAMGLRAHMDGCEPCRLDFDRYARAVEQVRGLRRERAPDALASLILKRVRRKSFRARLLSPLEARPPAELVVVLLAAAGAAVLLYLFHP